MDAQRPRCGGVPAIAACLDHADAQRHVKLSNQIGQQHNTAGENANDRDRSMAVMLSDLSGKLLDTLSELLFGKQDFHATQVFLASNGGKDRD